jgi:hypothetical protein
MAIHEQEAPMVESVLNIILNAVTRELGKIQGDLARRFGG